MKIDISKFSHLPSELPKQGKRKLKIYIAYKAKISRYLAYIIYKTLSSCELFELFYDRANIQMFNDWKNKMEVNMNQSDCVLIIGEEGAFDSFKLKKYRKDEFIKEIISGLDKRKDVYYIPINGYKFWEDKILSKEKSCQKYGKRITGQRQHSDSLSLEGTMIAFDSILSMIKKALIIRAEECLQMYDIKQASEELRRQSISEQQREVNRIQTK